MGRVELNDNCRFDDMCCMIDMLMADLCRAGIIKAMSAANRRKKYGSSYAGLAPNGETGVRWTAGQCKVFMINAVVFLSPFIKDENCLEWREFRLLHVWMLGMLR